MWVVNPVPPEAKLIVPGLALAWAKFRDRLGRKRWIDHQDKGAADQARDRRDVAEQTEIQLVIKSRVDGVGCRGQVDRIAVGRRTHDRLGADIAGGAGPVLDDELLS